MGKKHCQTQHNLKSRTNLLYQGPYFYQSKIALAVKHLHQLDVIPKNWFKLLTSDLLLILLKSFFNYYNYGPFENALTSILLPAKQSIQNPIILEYSKNMNIDGLIIKSKINVNVTSTNWVWLIPFDESDLPIKSWNKLFIYNHQNTC